jgi:hypothetical protein
MIDTRAVSTTLSYTLTLAISALLISGLIVAGAGYVDNRRDTVIRDELTVIGQQLVADIERADRLVLAGGEEPSLRVTKSVSDQVTGSGYRMTFDGSELVLESFDPEIEVTIEFVTETPVDDDSMATGGTIEISYDSTDEELVFDDV